MDKRYLLILIIIIVCCINLSIIVINSDVVGSASVSVGKYLFSVPEGFNLYEDNGNSAVIKNNENITIYIESDLSDTDTYSKRLNYIENETNGKILSEGTFTIENLSVNTVYFQSNDKINNSAFYFEKDNTQFKIEMSNFDHNTNQNLTLNYATFIIQSIHLNYKSN